jgi:hypothetical protein
MTYDAWKTRSPDDELAPEEFEDCQECGGEGDIEIWETVSRWAIDPPCAHVITCLACGGARGMICESVTNLSVYDLEERCGDA